MNSSTGDDYDAFISYSHAAGAALAKDVRHAIHVIGKPFWRRRIGRVFLDDASLPLAPSAWGAVASAIDRSRFFILLASPQAAESLWVDRELRHFLNRERGHERLLVVLTDGRLTWDDELGDFTTDSTACPSALFGAFPDEPLHVDLRWLTHGADSSSREGRLRSDLASVVAPVRGVEKDELIGVDIAQHRRTLTTVSVVAVCLAALTITALSLFRTAQTNARNERAQTVGAIAVAETSNQLDRALLLAAAAPSIATTNAVTRSLLTTVLAAGPVRRFVFDHGGPVRALARSPDGRHFVSGGNDGLVAVWNQDLDLAAGPVQSGGGTIRDIVVDERSDRAIIASQDGRLRAIDLGSADVVQRGQALPGELWALAAHPEDDLFFVGDDHGNVGLVDGDTLEVRESIDVGFDRILALSTTSDGQFLLVGGRSDPDRLGEPLVVVDLASREIIAEARDPADADVDESCSADCLSTVASVAVHPHDDGLVVFGTYGGSVAIWRFQDPDSQPTAIGAHAEEIGRIEFSSSGRQLVSTGLDHTVRFWDTATWTQVGAEQHHHGGQVWDAAFGEAGITAVTASEDGSLALITLDSDLTDIAQTLTSSDGLLTDVVVVAGPDGEQLLAVADGSTVVLFDAASLTEVGRLADDGTLIYALGYSEETEQLAAGHSDGVLRVWNLSAMAVSLRVPTSTTLNAVAFHPVENVIAVGGHPVNDPGGDDGLVEFLSTEDGTMVREPLEGVQASTLRGLHFAELGDELILSGVDSSQALRGWPGLTVESARPTTDRVATGGTFAPDGSAAIGSDRQTIELRDSSGQISGTLPGHSDVVFSLAFRPGEQMLASGGGDGLVRLWDLGDRLAAFGPPLRGHTGAVRSLAFSADGDRLFTASANEVIAWDLDVARWREVACDIANRRLTVDEWTAAVDATSGIPQEPCPR